MLGEIKDLASLKMRALELATGQMVTALQNNSLLPEPKEVIERAKVYEEYLKDGVKIPNSQGDFSSFFTMLPILFSINSENRTISPEMRIFFEKSGVDPSLLDALCGNQSESEENGADDLIDKVNESREIHYGGCVIKEWVHPELRNEKHRYEIIQDGKIMAKGDDVRWLIFENL